MNNITTKKIWWYGYYSSLLDCTVKAVEIVHEAGDEYGGEEFWPRLTFVNNRTGEEFVCEISKDEEGNGAGFMFGLPLPE